MDNLCKFLEAVGIGIILLIITPIALAGLTILASIVLVLYVIAIPMIIVGFPIVGAITYYKDDEEDEE